MKAIVAVAVVGATLAAASGAVASSGGLKAQMVPVALSQAGPNIVANPRRCYWRRTSVRNEYGKLSQAGYIKIKYVKTSIFRPRCARFMHFTACRNNLKKYQVKVRFIGLQRYVIAQYQGVCIAG